MNKTNLRGILIPVFLLYAVFIGCSKVETQPAEVKSDNFRGSQHLSSIKMLAKEEDKKIAYSSLTPEERYALWQAKLEIASNSTTYSSVQVEKILEIKNALHLDYFKSEDKKKIFQLSKLPEWIKSVSGIFSSDQIYNLIFTLNDIDRDSSNRVELVADCKCAVNSSWTCYNLQEGAGPSGEPVYKYQDCTKTGKCTELTNGCGAFWDDECDGDTCTPYPSS